ncbi:MAG: iron transporter [Deltaproteobacteria bacterium]|nr:MAG: iron transporter [Deltaproteobacteria bacterium]
MTAAHRRALIRLAVFTGLKKGGSGFIWISKILIPISFFTTLLVWSGAIDAMEFILEPVLGLFHLPAAASIPLIIGMLTGIYGAVAAMSALPLCQAHMTLIAVFLLIAHNLIQETAVQAKSGLKALPAALIRISAGFITLLAIAPFLTIEPAAPNMALSNAAFVPFRTMIADWIWHTGAISLKIFCIIMGLMVVMEVMKAFSWINRIERWIRPVLVFLGLPGKVGSIWLAGALFGLAYGSAVIVEEIKERDLSPEALQRLQVSIGINHAMIEDPALFLPLGIPAFWLWVPRLVTAVVMVQALRLIQYIRGPGAGRIKQDYR